MVDDFKMFIIQINIEYINENNKSSPVEFLIFSPFHSIN